jgi:hypothetical protein
MTTSFGASISELVSGWLEDESQNPLVQRPSGPGPGEQTFLAKLLEGEKKLVILQGALGSGKTLLLRYVAEQLMRDAPEHCGRCDQGRNILIISFDSFEYPDNIDEPGAARAFVQDAVLKVMQSAILSRAQVSREEEVTTYWDEQITEIASGTRGSFVFAHVHNRIADAKAKKGGAELTVDELLGLRDEVLKSPQLATEYVARLWNYAFHRKYGGNHRCQVLVFDNLDQVAPMVQSVLLDLMINLAVHIEPAIVAAFRPETWSRHGHNRTVVDINEHTGVSPLEVVIERLARFVIGAETYRNEAESISEREFSEIVLACKELLRVLATSRTDRLVSLLEGLSGQDIRSTLVLCQRLIRAAGAGYSLSQKAGQSDLVQMLLTGGATYFQSAPKGFIQNIFTTEDPVAWRPLLLKLRVLQIVGTAPGQVTTIAQLMHAARGFSYTDEQVAAALNELLSPYRQLLRSNGQLTYSPLDLAESAGQYSLALTRTGEGYLRQLPGILGYVEQVMFEARIDIDEYRGILNDGSLLERLRVLEGFLRYVMEQDEVETRTAVNSIGMGSVRGILPDGLLCMRLVEGCSRSATAILASVLRSNAGNRGQDQTVALDLERRFKQLTSELRALNAEFLY